MTSTRNLAAGTLLGETEVVGPGPPRTINDEGRELPTLLLRCGCGAMLLRTVDYVKRCLLVDTEPACPTCRSELLRGMAIHRLQGIDERARASFIKLYEQCGSLYSHWWEAREEGRLREKIAQSLDIDMPDTEWDEYDAQALQVWSGAFEHPNVQGEEHFLEAVETAEEQAVRLKQQAEERKNNEARRREERKRRKREAQLCLVDIHAPEDRHWACDKRGCWVRTSSAVLCLACSRLLCPRCAKEHMCLGSLRTAHDILEDPDAWYGDEYLEHILKRKVMYRGTV